MWGIKCVSEWTHRAPVGLGWGWGAPGKTQRHWGDVLEDGVYGSSSEAHRKGSDCPGPKPPSSPVGRYNDYYNHWSLQVQWHLLCWEKNGQIKSKFSVCCNNKCLTYFKIFLLRFKSSPCREVGRAHNDGEQATPEDSADYLPGSVDGPRFI